MRDYIFIQLDKRRRLKFTKEPLDIIFKKLGYKKITLKEGREIEEGFRSQNIEYLALFTWAGLAWEDPNLSINAVRNILKTLEDDPGKLGLLVIALMKAASLLYGKLGRAGREVEGMKRKIERMKREI